MQQRPPLDQKTVDKLRKIWAMRGSNYSGEREAAENRALFLIDPFGYELDDVERLLQKNGQSIPETASQFADRVRRKREAPARAELIRKYGSRESVVAWQPLELRLRKAVASISTFGFGHRKEWVETLDGFGFFQASNLPQHVLELIASAHPLPATIGGAYEEAKYWRERDRELGLIFFDTINCQLDLPAYARFRLVERLLTEKLQSNSLDEVLLRARYGNENFPGDELIEQAILRDIERLVANPPCEHFQTGRGGDDKHQHQPQSTTSRRLEVEALLANRETAALSDREIARRVRVSPMTVGNARRRLSAGKEKIG